MITKPEVGSDHYFHFLQSTDSPANCSLGLPAYPGPWQEEMLGKRLPAPTEAQSWG